MLKHPFITAALTALVLSTSYTTMAVENTSTKNAQVNKSFDGLRKIDSPIEGRDIYMNPTADFSQFETIQILKAYVAFKKDWKKDFDKKHRSIGIAITDKEILTIKAKVSETFDKEFKKEFNQNGYPVVDVAKSKTLLIRPALVDLDLINPGGVIPPSNSKSFTREDESVTLYLELYDGVTGEILARIAENKNISKNQFYGWQNRSRNNSDMVRVLTEWAKELRTFLDNAHKNKNIKGK